MRLEVVESLSVASGAENEDRVGHTGAFAWVIDGATDVLPTPLTPSVSDAAWFAAEMDAALRHIAADPPPVMSEIPALVAARIAPRFAAAALRPPAGRGEHPSAAAVIIRPSAGDAIDYVSLGDCVLLAETGDGFARIGIDEARAGDAWVASALAASGPNGATLSRADLWPRLRAQRARMNAPDGYGIFSLTAPDAGMITHGSLDCPQGSRILLASDGLMRLVDVFRRYHPAALFAAAWDRGLAPLVTELRALETSDSHCRQYPRAKVSDDTSGLLLRVMPSAP